MIPLVSAVIGGLIVMCSAIVVQRANADAERRRVDAANARQDAAVRAIVVALMDDLYGYVLAGYARCSFDPQKWGPPLNRLLDWSGKIEFAQALGADSERVLSAVLAVALANTNLKRLGTINPLKTAKDEREEAVIAHGYVGVVRGIIAEARRKMEAALSSLIGVDNIPKEADATADEVLMDLRNRLSVERSTAEAMKRLKEGDSP